MATKGNTTPPKKSTTRTKSAVAKTRTSRTASKKTGSTTKKTTTKRTSAKTSRSKKSTSTKSTRNTKKATSRTSQAKKAVQVTLPRRMSMRAQEKALVLGDAVVRDFYSSFVTIARVSAVCFLAVGAAYTTSFLHKDSLTACTGLSCVAVSNLTLTANTIDGAAEPAIGDSNDIVVTVLSDVPDTLEKKTTVKFEVTGASLDSAVLKTVSENGEMSEQALQTFSLSNNKYETFIQPVEQNFATHQLIVNTSIPEGDGSESFTLATFTTSPEATSSIEKDDVLTTSLPAAIEGPEVMTENTSVLEGDEPEKKESSDSIATAPEDKDERNSETQTWGVTELTEPQEPSEKKEAEETREKLSLDEPVKKELVEVTDEADQNVIVNDKPANDSEQIFTVVIDPVISGLTMVGYTTPPGSGVFEFYARPISGMTAQLLSTPQRGRGEFMINTTNLPNGSYEFFATVQEDGRTMRSTAAFAEVKNTAATPKLPEGFDTTVPIINITRSNPGVSDEVEPIVDTNSTPVEGLDVTDAAKDIAQDRLLDNREELDRLFTAYAAAQQSGDEALIAAAEEAIDKFSDSIITNALKSDTDRYIASDLSAALDETIADRQQRVQRFEALRAERTENDTAVDTDQDGISDLDEELLYNTDPEVADTDNDGFTDGAEIVGGFNPLDPSAEAVIDYESPRDSVGVVVTDKLQITSVTPNIILEEATEEEEQVQATISGQGLPNSFVTLYIFSTPTIVTVKTDPAGGFEYTFTKELEDGQHQVFAVLTGNTGEIVAQSEPFTFIKQARAFTPVDANLDDAGAGLYTEVQEPESMYPIVFGMSIIALGILLFLLSIHLRMSHREELLTTDQVV